jgi:hypothetical protein
VRRQIIVGGTLEQMLALIAEPTDAQDIEITILSETVPKNTHETVLNL